MNGMVYENMAIQMAIWTTIETAVFSPTFDEKQAVRALCDWIIASLAVLGTIPARVSV
jgi:hypothetical protein